MKSRFTRVMLAALLLVPSATPQAGANDPVMQAMRAELARVKQLRLPGAEPPYYVEYALDDSEHVSASASLGGLTSLRTNRLRLPRTVVRVGDPKFDNTNYVLSDLYSGTRYDPEQFPLDDSVPVLRHHLWLATDRLYKAAVEILARKRAALQNLSVAEPVPDFAPATPRQAVREVPRVRIDAEDVTRLLRSASGVFLQFPKVTTSSVDYESSQSTYYFANTEGTLLRQPDHLHFARVRASAMAGDGMMVRDAVVFNAFTPDKLPSRAELSKAAELIGANVTALAGAPRAEEYAGPVLFEGLASAQLFAEVLGPNLSLPRRPVSEPGRPVPFAGSELETRRNSRILPEWMDVVDDPTKPDWEGRPLLGHYEVDYEGVVPEPLTLIEKGRVRNFLLTRQPVKRYVGSNGRARMPGRFGARTAVFSNLFVRAGETVPGAELKTRLLEMVKERDLPFGMMVRKMDFPSSAPADEVRQVLSGNTGGRPISSPLMLYRVYPDGREELVRGLRFRGLNTRALRDIVAASRESTAFSYQNNLAAFALMGAGQYVTACSVVAPSVLFEDLELEVPQDEQPKPPVVPPPS